VKWENIMKSDNKHISLFLAGRFLNCIELRFGTGGFGDVWSAAGSPVILDGKIICSGENDSSFIYYWTHGSQKTHALNWISRTANKINRQINKLI
jgi:hypothetical protein